MEGSQAVNDTLHITSGDIAGKLLAKSGIQGDVLVWHDILYDGPREPGWPDDKILNARAQFIERTTGGGLDRAFVLNTLKHQYERLAQAKNGEKIVLWFDGCLFDQSMLAHILTCMDFGDIGAAELLCVDAFPGIDPFNGLGQLNPEQLALLFGQRRSLTRKQFEFAAIVDRAFATQEPKLFGDLAAMTRAPLPWVPAAVARWLQEQPDPCTGLGRLETLALEAVRSGCKTPPEIFKAVAAADTPPQYWGDITLWAKINALADRKNPLIKIEGLLPRLPQWEGLADLTQFRIEALPDAADSTEA